MLSHQRMCDTLSLTNVYSEHCINTESNATTPCPEKKEARVFST